MALIEKGHEEHYILIEPFPVKMNFICMRMKNHFHIDDFRTWTHFETEG